MVAAKRFPPNEPNLAMASRLSGSLSPFAAVDGGAFQSRASVDLRFINWIWHVRGSLPLASGQSRNEALERLAPLFRQTGTTHWRTADGLTFRKKNQPAQDKMAVFDSGTLSIDGGAGGAVLRYSLVSHALLFCFVLPLLFLGFAQATIAIGKLQHPSSVAGKPQHTAHKPAKPAPKPKALPMNPIDKALGAPAPEKPKGDQDGGPRDRKPSPTPAYVFASLFAILYVIGRVLEDRMVRALFRKHLDAGVGVGSAA